MLQPSFVRLRKSLQRASSSGVVSAASDMASSASSGMGKKMTSLKDKVEGTLGRLSLVSASEVDVKETEEEKDTSRVVMDTVAPQDSIASEKRLSAEAEVNDVKAQLITAKLKARLAGSDNDGVLGLVQSSDYCPDAIPNAQDYCPIKIQRECSLRDNKFMKYNMSRMKYHKRGDKGGGGEEEEGAKVMDVQDISYVRKPCLRRMLEEYEGMYTVFSLLAFGIYPKYLLDISHLILAAST